MRYRRNKKSRAKKIEADAGIERGLWVKDAESENQRVPGRADARARACARARARSLASSFELMYEGGLFLFPFRSANEIPFYKHGVFVSEDVVTRA